MKIPGVGTIHLPINRRTFLETALTGLAATALFPTALFAEDERISFDNYRIVPLGRNQKPLIFFWLDGGLSHIDTFCPMLDAPQEVRGPYSTIATSVPSLRISEKLPHTANVMDKVLLMRNIYHTQQDHRAAINKHFTGNDGTINGPPTTKPFTVKLNDHLSQNNLGYVILTPDGVASEGVGSRDALVVSRNYYGRDHQNRPYDMPQDRDFDRNRFRARQSLLGNIENRNLRGQEVERWSVLRERVNSIIDGDIDRAFDLSSIPEREKERYGKTDIGYAALTAKRMVGVGVPFILIFYREWDHHQNIKSSLDEKLPILDKALASLIEDLHDRAVIALGSEFGRAPSINSRSGREHWPQANVMLISGPRIPNGITGELTRDGYITGRDGPFKAELMGPTILRACGYELVEERAGVLSQNKMPFYPIF